MTRRKKGGSLPKEELKRRRIALREGKALKKVKTARTTRKTQRTKQSKKRTPAAPSQPAGENAVMPALIDVTNQNTEAIRALSDEQGVLIKAVESMTKQMNGEVETESRKQAKELVKIEAEEEQVNDDDWIEILLDKATTGHSKQLVHKATGAIKYID